MKFRIFVAALVLCMCLASCRGTVSESSKETISTASTVNEDKSQAENINIDSTHIYWTNNSDEIEALEYLQHKEILTEDEVHRLASLILDKAWYLCFLAYKYVPSADGDIDVVTDSNEIVEYDGKRYNPAGMLPYRSTEEMLTDIYKTFEKTDNIAQYFNFVDTLYADIDGYLYCCIDADGQSNGRTWQEENAIIETISADRIVLNMPVQFMDSIWKDNLEIVWRNDAWTLNESYFAKEQPNLSTS